jgi:hypothetical protein
MRRFIVHHDIPSWKVIDEPTRPKYSTVQWHLARTDIGVMCDAHQTISLCRQIMSRFVSTVEGRVDIVRAREPAHEMQWLLDSYRWS